MPRPKEYSRHGQIKKTSFPGMDLKALPFLFVKWTSGLEARGGPVSNRRKAMNTGCRVNI